jgi:branched-chain amino acid transport system ATP-binding protein
LSQLAPTLEADATAASALEVQDLSLHIGGAKILESISLAVRRGETLCVIGPNCAGKTTLFNLISGIRPPTRGRILLDGREVTHESIPTRAQRGLGRTFQTSSVFPFLSVHENVRLAAEAAMGGSMRLWRRPLRYQPAMAKTREALEAVGLTDRSAWIAGALSHGDKRRLEIAIVLASDASTILLDEPMAGMATENVGPLTDLIRSLARDYGRTVLLVEHHMHVVLGVADRIAVLHHGELLAVGSPEEVMNNTTVQTAYLGEAL